MVGENLFLALHNLKISNKEIADEFNVSAQYVSSLKKNKKINDFISQVAIKYNINLHWLLTGDGDMFIQPKESEISSNSLLTKMKKIKESIDKETISDSKTISERNLEYSYKRAKELAVHKNKIIELEDLIDSFYKKWRDN